MILIHSKGVGTSIPIPMTIFSDTPASSKIEKAYNSFRFFCLIRDGISMIAMTIQTTRVMMVIHTVFYSFILSDRDFDVLNICLIFGSTLTFTSIPEKT